MAKDFKPYADLWKTIRLWNTRSEAWLNGPWDKLDPEELDNTYENSNKTMNQVFRYFRDKDLPKIFEIAEKMKADIDAFKPVVPVAIALRKEGMKERHWK